MRANRQSGEVYLWGFNRYAQCGQAPPDNQLSPRRLPLGALTGGVVADVVCGRHHTALLTTAGQLYTWGAAGFGRLGHGDHARVVAYPSAHE